MKKTLRFRPRFETLEDRTVPASLPAFDMTPETLLATVEGYGLPVVYADTTIYSEEYHAEWPDGTVSVTASTTTTYTVLARDNVWTAAPGRESRWYVSNWNTVSGNLTTIETTSALTLPDGTEYTSFSISVGWSITEDTGTRSVSQRAKGRKINGYDGGEEYVRSYGASADVATGQTFDASDVLIGGWDSSNEGTHSSSMERHHSANTFTQSGRLLTEQFQEVLVSSSHDKWAEQSSSWMLNEFGEMVVTSFTYRSTYDGGSRAVTIGNSDYRKGTSTTLTVTSGSGHYEGEGYTKETVFIGEEIRSTTAFVSGLREDSRTLDVLFTRKTPRISTTTEIHLGSSTWTNWTDYRGDAEGPISSDGGNTYGYWSLSLQPGDIQAGGEIPYDKAIDLALALIDKYGDDALLSYLP